MIFLGFRTHEKLFTCVAHETAQTCQSCGPCKDSTCESIEHIDVGQCMLYAIVWLGMRGVTCLWCLCCQ